LFQLRNRRGRAFFAGGLAAVALFVPVGSGAAARSGTSPSSTGSILEVLYAPVGAKGGPVSIDLYGESLARARTARAAFREAWYQDAKGRLTVKQLNRFLARKRSPMATHADEIIVAANRYHVDPRVVVAIAGVESTFGLHSRGFNAWGWNGGSTRWRSWTESIDTYTRLLGQKYPNHRNVASIARRYNPVTPSAWSRKVQNWIRSLDALTG
jgi:transglycosylase-like protein with SLT domain